MENKILSEIIKDIKDLIKKEHCTNLENCNFCANVGDCLNRKILEKIQLIERNNNR